MRIQAPLVLTDDGAVPLRAPISSPPATQPGHLVTSSQLAEKQDSHPMLDALATVGDLTLDVGTMLYWDGTGWALITPATSEDDVLTWKSGSPKWYPPA